jgi:hypothetical protein
MIKKDTFGWHVNLKIHTRHHILLFVCLESNFPIKCEENDSSND